MSHGLCPGPPAIVIQKTWAMTVQAVLLAAAVTVCVVAGRGFQLAVAPGNAVAVAAALTLAGLDFGLITMAAGAAAGRRVTALGIGAGLAAASYLLSSLATTISAIPAQGLTSAGRADCLAPQPSCGCRRAHPGWAAHGAVISNASQAGEHAPMTNPFDGLITATLAMGRWAFMPR